MLLLECGAWGFGVFCFLRFSRLGKCGCVCSQGPLSFAKCQAELKAAKLKAVSQQKESEIGSCSG